ncbi:hypothetical protein, partial [Tannerella forsythia]|uniref:hypothetical protein n=1 Tax=Tannerella forsythia TaxID=28112 RepID=UPI001C8985D1
RISNNYSIYFIDKQFNEYILRSNYSVSPDAKFTDSEKTAARQKAPFYAVVVQQRGKTAVRIPDTRFPEQKQLFERRILSFQDKNSCLNAGYSVSRAKTAV